MHIHKSTAFHVRFMESTGKRRVLIAPTVRGQTGGAVGLLVGPQVRQALSSATLIVYTAAIGRQYTEAGYISQSKPKPLTRLCVLTAVGHSVCQSCGKPIATFRFEVGCCCVCSGRRYAAIHAGAAPAGPADTRSRKGAAAHGRRRCTKCESKTTAAERERKGESREGCGSASQWSKPSDIPIVPLIVSAIDRH